MDVGTCWRGGLQEQSGTSSLWQPPSCVKTSQLLHPSDPADRTVVVTPAIPPCLQAKRLDELDRLYRDEALARKRAHNAMEDLKARPAPHLVESAASCPFHLFCLFCCDLVSQTSHFGNFT